jgi:hypothetical protein
MNPDELEKKIRIKCLAGRLAHGFEGGKGNIFHGVVEGVAVCGAKPGRRSAGWVPFDGDGKEITCPKCLRRIQC